MLAHFVSLLSYPTRTEKHDQERGRVHSFHGVKADTTAFHPTSESKWESVPENLNFQAEESLRLFKHICVIKMILVQCSS